MRLILWLCAGWALLFAANHLLFEQARTRPGNEFEAALRPKTSTDRHINSWGAYLPRANAPDQKLASNLKRLAPVAKNAEVPAPKSTMAPKFPHPADDQSWGSRETKLTHADIEVKPQAANNTNLDPKSSHAKAVDQTGLPEKKFGTRPVRRTVAVSRRENSSSPSRQRSGLGLFAFAPPGF